MHDALYGNGPSPQDCRVARVLDVQAMTTAARSIAKLRWPQELKLSCGDRVMKDPE